MSRASSKFKCPDSDRVGADFLARVTGIFAFYKWGFEKVREASCIAETRKPDTYAIGKCSLARVVVRDEDTEVDELTQHLAVGPEIEDGKK